MTKPPALPTMAARVPHETRRRAEQAAAARAARGETFDTANGPRPFDLSELQRQALALWLDVEDGKVLAIDAEDGKVITVSREQFTDMVRELAELKSAHPLDRGQGTARRNDRPTSKSAASNVAPRVGSQRRRALNRIVGAGFTGMTTDEVIRDEEREARLTGKPLPAANGLARRVTDLLQVGAITELKVEETAASLADGTAREPVTRKTRHGSDAVVWIATDKGRAWAQENRA